MKYLLFAIAFISSTATAQTTYNSKISVAMTDGVNEAGTVFKRKATVRTIIRNDETQTLNVGVIVRLMDATGATELNKWLSPLQPDFTIDNNIFVKISDGSVVGNLDQLHAAFGVIKKAATDSTPTVWWKSVMPNQKDSLTTPCMGWYDYSLMIGDDNKKYNNFIKSLVTYFSSQGKLN